MAEFFAMGGYAAYVWSAYGLVFGTMALMLAISIRRARKAAIEAEALKSLVRRHGRRGRG